MRLRTVLAISTLASLIANARDARADFDFQLSLGMNARWMRETPALKAPELTTNARELPAAEIPMRGGLTMLGGYVDTSVTFDDRWVVPLFGGGLYGALGRQDALITSRDGSIVRAQPWTTGSFELYLPGLGLRTKQRRWMFGASLRTGVSFLWMHALLADGAAYAPMDLTRATFLLQGELEACRRLDPATRVCLQVAPRIYEHEVLNGVLFGIRAEWGR